MRGHIRKRGQTWTIVYDHGPDPVTGRRRQRWRGGFRTRKEAERELARALHEVNQGGDPFPDTLLLRPFVERWLEHQRTRIRPRTFERYSQQMRDHVFPEIGNVPLTKLRPAHVQRVLDSMASKGFGPRSIVQARSILGAALRQAVAWGITTTNPVSAVKPPKPDRPQLAVPLRNDLLRVLIVAEGTVWEIPILLAIATGARRAEVLGLCWDAVDLERGRIRIVRGIQRIPGGGGLRFVEPKTDRGRREVALPAFAIVRLKEHRRRQAASRLAQGPQWLDLGIVCDRGDVGRSTQTRSPGLSSASRERSVYRPRRDCMTCATPSQRCCWRRECTPR